MTDRHKCGRCDRLTTDALCGGCVRHAQRILVDIRGLFVDLDDTVSRQSRGASLVKIRRGRGPGPLPFLDDERITRAHADLDYLYHWANYATGRQAHSVLGAVETLRQADSWFRVDPEAKRCIDVLHTVRRALRAAVDRPATIAYLGRCGATITEPVTVDNIEKGLDRVCESTLGEVLDDQSIKCRGCGTIHTPGSRNASAVAAMTGAVLPLPVILDALPHLIGHRPKPHTVRNWIRRGRLRPATWVNLTRGEPGINNRTDENGNLLYMADDVLALVRDTHARPGPRRKDVPA